MPLLRLFLLGLCLAATAQAGDVPLVARDALFGNPERTQARLSPDGRHVSWLAPRDGLLNIWVAPAGDMNAAKPVTNDTKRGIRQHSWSYDGQHLLYLQDLGGDENWRLHAVRIDGGGDRDLTPLDGVQARILGLSHERPNLVLVGLNDRVAEWHDVYEIDLATGARTLVMRNEGEFAEFFADLKLRPQVALKNTEDGGEIFRRNGAGWSAILKYGHDDSLTTAVVGIEGDGAAALLLTSVGRDKSAALRIDLASGRQTVVAESGKADVEEIWLHPRTRVPDAYVVNHLQTKVLALDEATTRDIERLDRAFPGAYSVTSRTLDNARWIVVADDPVTSLSTHLYERESGRISKLFDQRPQLAGAPLQPMRAVEIATRDGFSMVSYLTLPAGTDSDGDGRPARPLAMVLNVHGGPWARDVYGFDAEHQWLANRGYAVLSVNFRGSTGFGKAFVNAGNKEWAARMHDDLLDAVQWAVREKIAVESKIAVYGGSYGGYATLVGMTFTPERFACGVDVVGPSNLITLLESIPPYWKTYLEDFALRVGDPRTEQGRKLLTERSPLTRVNAIQRPLLIAQGANDPRVKQAESDQIVAAMKAKSLPVTYVVYPDEGHGFANPANRTSFYAVAEGFLAGCLGGRYEPVGDDFEGATLQVLEGAEHVPGLAASAAKKPSAAD
jgi:dipeptidyl aminopeptidase/acylaminoacyl peptidase